MRFIKRFDNLKNKFAALNKDIAMSIKASEAFAPRDGDKYQERLWNIAEELFMKTKSNVMEVYVDDDLYEYAHKMIDMYYNISPPASHKVKYYMTPYGKLEIKRKNEKWQQKIQSI